MKDKEEAEPYQEGYQLELSPGDSWLCICGQKTKLSGYVAAHWDIPLKYTCPNCKAEYSVLGGIVELINTSKQVAHDKKEG